MAGLVPAIHAFHALGLGSWVPGTRACPGPDPGPGKTSQRDLPPMSFPDITAELKASMPQLRGRLLANQALRDLTWFRVGGPAQILFMPEDEADLAYLLERLSSDVPVSAVGLGSNLIVRDGGVPGVLVRLGRGFAGIADTIQPLTAQGRLCIQSYQVELRQELTDFPKG